MTGSREARCHHASAHAARPGHLDVIDRSRQRPTLPIDLQERPVPPAMEGWSLFLGDLTVIEQAVGHRIDVPDEIPPDAAGVVRELAYILRAGASRMMVDRTEIVQTPEARAAFQGATGPLRITTDLDAELFGERLHFGTLVGDIHDWSVVETLADPESDRVVVAVARQARAAIRRSGFSDHETSPLRRWTPARRSLGVKANAAWATAPQTHIGRRLCEATLRLPGTPLGLTEFCAHPEESTTSQIPDPLLSRDPLDLFPCLAISSRLAARRIRRRDDSY